MAESKQSKTDVRIADTWLNEDFSGLAPEIQIMCHFDLYHDGDWTHAIRAAIIGLENEIPIEQWDWVREEVVAELRRSIKLEPRPNQRTRGRHARGQSWIDHMNQLSIVACWDAAKELGLKGQKRDDIVFRTLAREGVKSNEIESMTTLYKRHRLKMRQSALYQAFKAVWGFAIDELLDSKDG